MDKEAVIGVFGDTHCGNKLGLLSPKSVWTDVDEDGDVTFTPVRPNPAQKYLYKLFTDGKKALLKYAGDRPIYIIFTGDATNGDKHPAHNLSSDPLNQTNWAVDILSEMMEEEQVKGVYMCTSTQSHAYQLGSADHIIAQQLRNKFPDKRVSMVGHGIINVAGAKIDYAHHGAGGSIREYLDGNNVRYYLNSMFYEDLRMNQVPPNVIIRGHHHVRIEERITKFRGDDRFYMWGVTMPSFQLLTNYARKVTQSTARVTNGMLGMKIVDGQVRDMEWFSRTRDLRKRETV